MVTAVTWLGFSPLLVCLFVFPDDISKTDAARITELDTRMFHDEFWKPVYFGVKRSKVKVTTSSDCCVRKMHWVFPAARSRHASSASDIRFSLHHVPASACRWILGFSSKTLMVG